MIDGRMQELCDRRWARRGGAALLVGLAVCAALKIPTAQVTAIDVSPAALKIAAQNAAG